jgi:hypothetical protein
MTMLRGSIQIIGARMVEIIISVQAPTVKNVTKHRTWPLLELNPSMHPLAIVLDSGAHWPAEAYSSSQFASSL